MNAFWEALLAHKTLATLLLFFAVLAIADFWALSQRVDSWVFLYLNTRGWRPMWLDWTMLAITQLGSSVAALTIALAFAVADNTRLAYQLVLGAVTLWIVVELFKAVVGRSRPFIGLPEARVVGMRVRGLSFPSGHTSQAFFTATLIAQHFHAGVGLAAGLYAGALLVGITRIYVGAHYPRDVLAGMILGGAWGVLVGILS